MKVFRGAHFLARIGRLVKVRRIGDRRQPVAGAVYSILHHSSRSQLLLAVTCLPHTSPFLLTMHPVRLRSDLSASIKNAQRICTKDVEKLCENGRYVNGQTDAYTYWTDQHYKRHTYKHWSEVPFGFGNASDNCLRHEYEQYNAGTSRRLIPKCVEWIEESESQFEVILQREKGNDKREMFVLFSTIFATVMSGILGYIFGLFLNDRDDLFSYQNRRANRRVLIYFGIAITLPALFILWASVKLLLLMIGCFAVGRGAQYYVQMREEREYSSLPMSDSRSVFAAIPV